jgi:twitching motility protein PilU
MEREQAVKFMHDLLRAMVAKKASDLFITVGFPPAIKLDGKMTPVAQQSLTAQHTSELARGIMNDKQAGEFEATKECNFAVSPGDIGRFRVNAFMQQGRVGMVLRTINTTIPKFDDMKLPPVLKDVVMTKRGLVILVGGTGSGKSTSLAAMIGYRNENSYGHIITIEDPIEYVHDHKNCVVTQREVGVDTENWHAALKNTLRQAPDVILIGEIRDRETMSAAIAYSQSGHLVLATLHANNSYQALNRILNFYPVEVRPTMLNDLASSLRVIVSQRLLRAVDGCRVPALEVMVNTRLISELIENGDFFAVREALENSLAEASQTFEVDLARLIQSGRISRAEGLAYADSPANLMWRLDNSAGPPDDKKAAAGPTDPPAGRPFSDFTIDVKP